MRRLVGWLLPGGLVLAAAVGLDQFAGAAFVDEAVRSYPWVVYGVAFLLAAYFHRSRLALGALVLAATDVFFVPGADPVRLGLTGTVAMLLLGGLSLGRDRGLLSPGGAMQSGAVLAGAASGLLLWWKAPWDLRLVFSAAPMPHVLTVWTGLPQAAAIAFGLAGLAVIGGALRWRGPAERGLAWCLPTLALATEGGGSPSASLYLMAGALLLGLSVIETSYAMAYRDDLTGLPSRRAMVRDLEALSGTYTLAMVDIDHFKKFNDRHGHDVGDQVLKMVATRLEKTTGGGRAYRYGGEEFMLLYAGCLRKEALPHAEAVREAVEEERFSVRSWSRPRKKPVTAKRKKKSGKPRGKTLSVTVSIGLADSTLAEATPEKVLKKADKALYRAKRAGRNRVAK